MNIPNRTSKIPSHDAAESAAVIEGFYELVQLAHDHPHHHSEFLEACEIVDSQGKEAK